MPIDAQSECQNASNVNFLGCNTTSDHIAFFDLDDTLVKGNMSVLYGRYLYEKKMLFSGTALFAMAIWSLFQVGLLQEYYLHKILFRLLFFGQKAELHAMQSEQFCQVTFPSVLRPEVQAELKKIQQRGGQVVILSSSPTFIVQPFAQRLGVERVVATIYKQDDHGIFSTVQPFLGQDKQQVVSKLVGHYKETSAYSDSILDLGMLESVNTPVAVAPKPALRRVAKLRGWRVIE